MGGCFSCQDEDSLRSSASAYTRRRVPAQQPAQIIRNSTTISSSYLRSYEPYSQRENGIRPFPHNNSIINQATNQRRVVAQPSYNAQVIRHVPIAKNLPSISQQTNQQRVVAQASHDVKVIRHVPIAKNLPSISQQTNQQRVVAQASHDVKVKPEPLYGQFKCRCGHYWVSLLSWRDKYQTCKCCKSQVRPRNQREVLPTDYTRDKADAGEHPKELCEVCQQLGRYCGRFNK